MISTVIDEVMFETRCTKCGVRTRVYAKEIHRDGAVTLYRAEDVAYCRCGGQHRTGFQVAISSDPENRPVMKIVPVSEAKP